MLNIAIRVANYDKSGKGHLSRCSNIRNYLNTKVVWFLDKPSSFLEKKFPKDLYFIEKNDFSLTEVEKNITCKEIGLVLVDSYKIDTLSLKILNKKIPIAVILDIFKILPVEITICSTPLMSENSKIINKNNHLIGLKYAPVSYMKSRLNKKKNKILISMGNIDTVANTIKAIKALKRIYKKNFFSNKTIITIGKESKIISSIQKEIRNYEKYFELVIEEKNMLKLYENIFFALGAPGIAHLERLHLGIPTILLPQNSFHEKLIKVWIREKCALKAQLKISSIEKEIIKMYNNSEIRNTIKRNGIRAVDGQGPNRISKKLISFLKN